MSDTTSKAVAVAATLRMSSARRKAIKACAALDAARPDDAAAALLEAITTFRMSGARPSDELLATALEAMVRATRVTRSDTASGGTNHRQRSRRQLRERHQTTSRPDGDRHVDEPRAANPTD